MNQIIEGYQLLDSGEGRKLEKFGERIVDRPSTLCAWSRRESAHLWQKAHACYIHDKGWKCDPGLSTTWRTPIQGTLLELELLSNGQVGLFPEHALYLSHIKETISQLKRDSEQEIRILNLFAYSGLATAFCARIDRCHVTHVDLSKRAIEWAKRNAELNEITSEQTRWIVDDALGFMAREARKSQTYDIVIIDPPSFSRLSKKNSWTLDEKAAEITELVLSVIRRDRAAIYFTNHSSASTADIVRNIALDSLGDDVVDFTTRSLAIAETSSRRLLPAGALIMLSLGLQ